MTRLEPSPSIRGSLAPSSAPSGIRSPFGDAEAATSAPPTEVVSAPISVESPFRDVAPGLAGGAASEPGSSETPPPPSALRGGLVERAAPPATPESPLRGSLSRAIGSAAVRAPSPSSSSSPSSGLRGHMGRTERAERDTPVSAHAPTWELKLGKYGTGYGDLEKDGFEARNSNATSGQDAFAVSADRKRFAVTDGLGGAADTEGTAFLARYFADVAVQRGVDTVLNPDSLKALYREAEDAFAAQTGRRFARSTIARKEAGSAVTTLTYAEVIDSTHVRIVTIGDSPAFLLGSDRRRVRQYGEDALSGHTDKRLAFKLGIDEQGKPMAIDTTDMRIVNKIIEVPEGHSVAIGTDYFSDFAAARGDFNDFIGQTPEVFHDRSRRSGSKPDDATLITIDPARLALAS